MNPAEIIDNGMVNTLACEMKTKLARARQKGRGGWESPAECSVIDLHRMLLEHACKPNMDFVDVANFAGMLQARLEANHAERDVLARHLAQLQPDAEQWRRVAGLLEESLTLVKTDLDAHVIIDDMAALHHINPALEEARKLFAAEARA